MLDSLKQKWTSLEPAKKKRAVMLSVLLLVLVVSFFGYKATRGDKSKAEKPLAENKKELSLDSRMLEKSMYYESQKEISDLKAQLEDLKKLREEKESAGEKVKEKEDGKDLDAFNKRLSQAQPPIPQFFPPPPTANVSASLPPNSPASPEGQHQKPKVAH